MGIPANILFKEGQSQLVALINQLLTEIPLYQVEAMLKDVLHEVHEATEAEYRKACSEYGATKRPTTNTDIPKGEE